MMARSVPRSVRSEKLRSPLRMVRRALSVLGSGSSVLTAESPMATTPDMVRYTGFQIPALRSGTKEFPLNGFLFGPR